MACLPRLVKFISDIVPIQLLDEIWCSMPICVVRHLTVTTSISLPFSLASLSLNEKEIKDTPRPSPTSLHWYGTSGISATATATLWPPSVGGAVAQALAIFFVVASGHRARS